MHEVRVDALRALAARAEARRDIERRWRDDLPRLRACFGALPDAPDAIEAGLGDCHAGGRSVARVSAGGRQVYYKPRPPAQVLAWERLLEGLQADAVLPLPGPAFRPVRCASVDHYWEAAVEPTTRPADAADCFALGAWQALFALFGSLDMYASNLRLTDAGPCLLDAETVMHGARGAVRTQALPCVLRAGLLPVFRPDADGRHGERSVLMRWLRGQAPEALDRACEAFATGFARTLQAALARREACVRRLVQVYAGVPLRHVLRPTQAYLAGATPTAGWLAFEARALQQGDVPLLVGAADGRELYFEDEPVLRLDASPLEAAQQIIAAADAAWCEDAIAAVRQRVDALRTLLALRAGVQPATPALAAMLWVPAVDGLLQAEPLAAAGVARVDWRGVAGHLPDRGLRARFSGPPGSLDAAPVAPIGDAGVVEALARHFYATGRLGGCAGVASPSDADGLAAFCRGLSPWLA